MSKVAPKISKPGSSKFPTKGPHNPNVGTHKGGMAPKPQGGAPMPGNDRPSAPGQAQLARVPNVGTGANQGAMPLEKPPAGLQAQRVGQSEAAPRGAGTRVAPSTKMPVAGNPVATNKPKRRGVGAAFYGEY